MPLQCPVCETVNEADALECAECGRQLLSDAQIDETVEQVPDLERASYAAETQAAQDQGVLPELELTHYAAQPMAMAERVAVEPTLQLAAGEVEPGPAPDDFESGREQDDGARTLPPGESEACPFCGVSSSGRICDGCGRRKARYTAAAGAPAFSRNEPAQLVCPHCFSRVIWALRCPECGVPMKPIE